MSVAYEHVRIAPMGELADEILHQSLKDELYNNCTEGQGNLNQETGTADTNTHSDIGEAMDNEERDEETSNRSEGVDNVPNPTDDGMQLMKDIFGEDYQGDTLSTSSKRRSFY